MANRENADEMQHHAAFHKDLHCLLRLKQPSGTEIHNLENSTCDPLKYKMGVPYSLYQYVWENPPEYKGLKGLISLKDGDLFDLILYVPVNIFSVMLGRAFLA